VTNLGHQGGALGGIQGRGAEGCVHPAVSHHGS
jgi:hypothetical protein